MQSKVTYLWKEPEAADGYRAAVSLHGHTNHSKECLYFIVEFANRFAPLRYGLARQDRTAQSKRAIKIDLWNAYWTPPLPPLSAYRLERKQIEDDLGLASMISITDHDNIEAPMLLRVVPEARQIPVSVEWSVPFRDVILHLGIHNLPSGKAESIMNQFAEYTKNPDEERLSQLLAYLHELPDVLVVLNHPMWDMASVGAARHVHTLSAFIAELGMFIHAFELNGLRSWEENQRVLHFAEGWNQTIVGGGDRHGCEPSATLNLTDTTSFAEFVHQIRKRRESHVLFMPQFKDPIGVRMVQEFLDVIRERPEFPEGKQRWDDRVFHPDKEGVIRPVSALWDKPPAFIEMTFAVFRLLELRPVRKAVHAAFGKPEHEMRFMMGGEVAP